MLSLWSRVNSCVDLIIIVGSVGKWGNVEERGEVNLERMIVIGVWIWGVVEVDDGLLLCCSQFFSEFSNGQFPNPPHLPQPPLISCPTLPHPSPHLRKYLKPLQSHHTNHILTWNSIINARLYIIIS